MKHIDVTISSIFVIVGAVVFVALVGGYFSSMNRDWYDTLRKPSWQPPNWAFPVAWNTIFVLCIASLILLWNTRPHTALTTALVWIFVFNGVANILWSALFFGSKLIFPAIFDAGILCLSTILIIVLGWYVNWVGAMLLIPYAAWTAFATYLTAVIYRLNT